MDSDEDITTDHQVTMDSDEDDSDTISFRKPLRYTNIYYREKLSLHANGILKLRALASNYKDEEEFNRVIIALLSIMANFKSKSCKTTIRNTNK